MADLVPSEENKRPVENVVAGGSVDRFKQRIRRSIKADEHNPSIKHYYFDNEEVDEETYRSVNQDNGGKGY